MEEKQQTYYIHFDANPNENPIIMNQQQYDMLLSVCDMCCSKEIETKPETQNITLRSNTQTYIFKNQIITEQEAIYLTELALHINIRRLTISIKHKIRNL